MFQVKLIDVERSELETGYIDGNVRLANTVAHGTIKNDDDYVVEIVTVDESCRVSEGESAAFEIRLANSAKAPEGGIRVEYKASLSPNGSIVGDSTGTVTIPAGENSVNLTIQTEGDKRRGDAEGGLSVDIDNLPSDVAKGNSRVWCTISDDYQPMFRDDNASTSSDLKFSVGDNERDITKAILSNDTYPDGKPAASRLLTIVDGAGKGKLRFDIDSGKVFFDPNGAFSDLAKGESKTYQFTYEVSYTAYTSGNFESPQSGKATATITIVNDNNPPVAKDITVPTITINPKLPKQVVRYDLTKGGVTDADDDELTIKPFETDINFRGNEFGDLGVITKDGNELVFTESDRIPNPDLSLLNPEDNTWRYAFSYTVTDGKGGEATAKVEVKLLYVPPPPDYCAASPCQNGGQCSNDADDTGFVCACAEGYKGKTCAEVDKPTTTDKSIYVNGSATKRTITQDEIDKGIKLGTKGWGASLEAEFTMECEGGKETSNTPLTDSNGNASASFPGFTFGTRTGPCDVSVQVTKNGLKSEPLTTRITIAPDISGVFDVPASVGSEKETTFTYSGQNGSSNEYLMSAECIGLEGNGTFVLQSVDKNDWKAPKNTTGEDKTCSIKVTHPNFSGELTESIKVLPETTTTEKLVEICDDGKDNDYDEDKDCADADCSTHYSCLDTSITSKETTASKVVNKIVSVSQTVNEKEDSDGNKELTFTIELSCPAETVECSANTCAPTEADCPTSLNNDVTGDGTIDCTVYPDIPACRPEEDE